MPPGLVVAWQAKLTTQPAGLSFPIPGADHADLGIDRPGHRTISGFPLPGCVNVRPLRILKRRLKATLSSMPEPTPQRASIRALVRLAHRRQRFPCDPVEVSRRRRMDDFS